MRTPSVTLATLLLFTAAVNAQRDPPLHVDKEKKTITIPCAIAQRKLDHLDKSYPIEVIATFAYQKPAKPNDPPAGQKAHETVVVIPQGVKPSAVHKAMEELGLKAGKPAYGEGTKAEGPEVRVFLEVPGPDGAPQRLPIEKALVDIKTNKPLPPLKWHFTGSAMKQPDPAKADTVYGADLTGTFIALFPVTNETVFQTNLTMKEEPLLKLETNKAVLPKEGTAVKLIIEVK